MVRLGQSGWLGDCRNTVHSPRRTRGSSGEGLGRVRVFLNRRLDDLLGRLVQPLDALHAGVAQRARDDLRAAVGPVEPGFAMTTLIFRATVPQSSLVPWS